MKKRLFLPLALAIFCAFFLPSCSSTKEKKKPTVLVSISPYQTFVKEIAEDTVDVKVAVPENANPHLYEPTPSQMKGFDNIQIWFQIKMPFESKLLTSLKSFNPKLKIIDLTQDMPPTPSSAITLNSCSSHHHDHDHEEDDVHYWMSPRLLEQQVQMITETLCKKFPEHAALYEKNAEKVSNKLHDLDERLHILLSTCKEDALIISHPDLTYFCEEYNLVQIAIECEGKSPLPQDMQKIFAFAKTSPVLCVFTQPQFDNKGSLAIAKHLHIPVFSLNPNDPNYFESLNQIANDLLTAKKQGTHE